MKINKIGYFVLGILAVLALYAVLVSAQITSPLNLNGLNRFEIFNYTNINAHNFSVGSGTNFMDIYSDGSQTLFDGKGYPIQFTDNVTSPNIFGNLSWSYLNTFPVACPAGSYLTALDNSVTCTAIATIPNNITIGTTNTQYFIFGSNTTIMTCGTSTEGAVYYSNSTHKHYGCNSTDWNALY